MGCCFEPSFKNKVNSPRLSYPIGSMVLVYIYMLTWLGYIDGIHVTIYSIHGSYGYAKLAWLNICGSAGPAGCCARYNSLNLWRLTFSRPETSAVVWLLYHLLVRRGSNISKYLKLPSHFLVFFGLWFTANPQNCWQNLSLYFSAEHI